MTIRILEMAHSPFCIPIVRALEACGVEVEREEVPNWDRSRIAEVTGGAYYQVPVLLHEEDTVYESSSTSQDVAKYVDEHFAKGQLFPDWATGLQEILIDYLESELEDTAFKQVDPRYMEELDPVSQALVRRHKERKFGPGCVEGWAAEKPQLEALMESHLLRFEAMLNRHPFLLGDAPIYADFLLYGILGNLTWKGWNQLPASCPQVADWNNRMRSFRYGS